MRDRKTLGVDRVVQHDLDIFLDGVLSVVGESTNQLIQIIVDLSNRRLPLRALSFVLSTRLSELS